MLAEKRIDVSVYARDKTPVGGSLKPNEQNVKNRAREVTFQQHIDRYVLLYLSGRAAQAEAEAWQRVDHFYHTYEVNSKSELESRRQAFKPPSARAKGKQRATSEGPSDDWLWLMPTDDALSEDFKSRVNLQVVKDVMASEPQAGEVHKDSLDNEIDDLRFKLDSLFSYVSTAVHMVNIVESELDHRFSLLSHALSARSRSLPPPAPSSSTSLSSHLPLLQRGGSHPPGESPRDVLRALSRIDKERPPGKIGDAARRAVREVQRVHEGGTSGAGERRITGLPPGVGATPRKVPGTPRRR
ncbi:hypothetical protein ID866_9377 [Astraeus odoratus]|nr:hypothetical protein ID866_9377 [Astraeus odoratus]